MREIREYEELTRRLAIYEMAGKLITAHQTLAAEDAVKVAMNLYTEVNKQLKKGGF